MSSRCVRSSGSSRCASKPFNTVNDGDICRSNLCYYICLLTVWKCSLFLIIVTLSFLFLKIGVLIKTCKTRVTPQLRYFCFKGQTISNKDENPQIIDTHPPYFSVFFSGPHQPVSSKKTPCCAPISRQSRNNRIQQIRSQAFFLPAYPRWPQKSVDKALISVLQQR